MAMQSDSTTADIKPKLTDQTTFVSDVADAESQTVVTKGILKQMLSELLQGVRSEIEAEILQLKIDVKPPPLNMVSEPVQAPAVAPAISSDSRSSALVPAPLLAFPSSTALLPFPTFSPTPAHLYKEEDDLAKWEGLKIKATQGSKTPIFSGSQWLAWKRSALLDLSQFRLLDTLATEPPVSILTLEDARRRSADSIVQGYFLARLSAPIHKDIVNCSSVKSIWDLLLSQYESATTATKNKLQDKWNALVQKPGQTMHNFIREIECQTLQMRNIGMEINEENKLHRLLTGMSSTWDDQKNLISVLEFPYDKARTLLTAMSVSRGESTDIPDTEVQAHLAQHQRSHPARPPQHLSSPRFCDSCGKDDHPAQHCPTGLPHKDKSGNIIKYCWNCRETGHNHRQCTYGSSPSN